MAQVTFEHGMLIRKASLVEKGVTESALYAAMETDYAMDVDDNFFSFGPHFGEDAIEEFRKRLIALGLEYWNDFFEISLDHPEWCAFSVDTGTSLSGC